MIEHTSNGAANILVDGYSLLNWRNIDQGKN